MLSTKEKSMRRAELLSCVLLVSCGAAVNPSGQYSGPATSLCFGDGKTMVATVAAAPASKYSLTVQYNSETFGPMTMTQTNGTALSTAFESANNATGSGSSANMVYDSETKGLQVGLNIDMTFDGGVVACSANGVLTLQ